MKSSNLSSIARSLAILSILILTTIALILTAIPISAGDVHIKGYYRKDGTYVSPHIRSSPDQYKWNNYGPSKNDNELMNPKVRDYDKDGAPNYLDKDDDNDGIGDDYDHNPYGRSDRDKNNKLDSTYQYYNPYTDSDHNNTPSTNRQNHDDNDEPILDEGLNLDDE